MLDDGFRLPAQVSKNGRPNDKAYVFEEREVKQHQRQPEDDSRKSKEETKKAVLEFRDPVAKMKDMCEVFDNICGRFTKEIHRSNEECGIDQARYHHPFP